MLHHAGSDRTLEEADPRMVIPAEGASIQRRFSPAMTTGVVCFALSLVFFYGAVLRVPLLRTHWLDLDPYPDAVEYFAQANSILRKAPLRYRLVTLDYPPAIRRVIQS